MVDTKYLVAIFAFMVLTTCAVGHKPNLQCEWSKGGIIEDCLTKVTKLPAQHVVPAGQYRSGGTWILWNARCVSPKAMFYFHSAYWLDVEKDWHPSDYGNYTQKRMFRQFPLLVRYLEKRHAFDDIKFVEVSARDIASNGGPPLCLE